MRKQLYPDSVTISVTISGLPRTITLTQERDRNGEFHPPVDELLSQAMAEALEWVRKLRYKWA